MISRVTHMAGVTYCSVLCKYNLSNQILKCKSFVFGTEIRGHASKFEAVDVCWVCLLLLSRCHRPFVILASHQPYAYLHVSLARTDMPAMDWIYVVYKDKRVAVSVPCKMFSRCI